MNPKTVPAPDVTPQPKPPTGSGKDRRKRCRAKIVGRVHIRGGVGTLDLFEDVGKTVNVTRDGLLLTTSRGGYWVGQILDVMFPYWTTPTAINVARRAKVVRNILMPDSHYAVAVQFEQENANGGEPSIAPGPKQVRVLAVEADPALARAMRDVLEQDGYQVVIVSNGAAGSRPSRE